MTETDRQTGDAVTNGGQVAHLLNENHRRALSSVLRRVELAAWRLEDRITRGEQPDLALTRFTHAPSTDQQAAILQLIRQLRGEVARLASDYRLEIAEEHVLRSIMGEFTLLWCDLEDSRPQKLRRYGAINSQAEKVLGPPIQRLIELMLAMNDVASGKAESIHLWQEATDTNSLEKRGV